MTHYRIVFRLVDGIYYPPFPHFATAKDAIETVAYLQRKSYIIEDRTLVTFEEIECFNSYSPSLQPELSCLSWSWSERGSTRRSIIRDGVIAPVRSTARR
jgi:hypothetical protein